MVWGNILARQGIQNKSKVFVQFSDESLSYEEFNARTNSLANSLVGLGVKKGSRVCIMFPNGIEFLLAMFALVKIGAVSVPLNIFYRSANLQK